MTLLVVGHRSEYKSNQLVYNQNKPFRIINNNSPFFVQR